MRVLTLVLIVVGLLIGCERKPEAPREVIQGFQTTFYQVVDNDNRWIEIAISVDGSKTFRMPVFFRVNGELVSVTDKEAKELIDKWLKARAENIASFGSIGMHVGQQGPFITIDRNNPSGM